jgi:uncharacterized Zn finger protein
MRFWSYRPYVNVATRRNNAQKEIKRLEKKGGKTQPVAIDGRTIAKSFWGKAWCDNLENYSDYSNRMPRGRTYVRNGSVIDLKISKGTVNALVMGSELYTIKIDIDPLTLKKWEKVKTLCAGQIGSLIELLQGRLSDEVMRIVTDLKEGLFPAPDEIHKDCSCPDWADLCKHIAAALYGVGARLDKQPELLFLLRGVDPAELISTAAAATLAAQKTTGKKRRLAENQLADVFNIELAPSNPSPEKQKPTQKLKKTGKPPKSKKNPVED